MKGSGLDHFGVECKFTFALNLLFSLEDYVHLLYTGYGGDLL